MKINIPVLKINVAPKNVTSNMLNDILDNVIKWKWAKALLAWLIMSAGTISELTFMMGAIWICINASVHPMVLQFMSDEQAKILTWYSTSAFIVLPELILAMAIVTVIGHIRMFFSNRKTHWTSLVWALLFAGPTIIFVFLSYYTIHGSTGNSAFELPSNLVQLRAMAGYTYALLSLLYTALGSPQEVDRLAKKDAMLAELEQEKERITAELQAENNRIKAQWQAEKERITAELQNHKAVIAQSKKQNEELQKAVIETAESALQAYSQDCINWLYSGIKTTNVDEINHYTGHSKRKLTYAMVNGKLQTATRNKELIVMSSLIEWLKENPPAADKKERDTGPILKVVNE